MRVDRFDFDLPPERIAQQPVEPRDAARMLHVAGDGTLIDRTVRDLPALLEPGDLLVVNDTKVLPTRLFGRRTDTGGRVEATLVEAAGPDRWIAYCRPAKRLRPGLRLDFGGGALTAEIAAKEEGGRLTLVFDRADAALREALWAVGRMPLPPYIKRPAPAEGSDAGTDSAADTEDADRTAYQTVFAAEEGAVAAPTAGLHFTPALLDAIAARGVETATVTLHVGAGTFAPVTAADTRGHVMHSEWARLTETTAAAVAATRARGGRIVAVGTTAMRTLESAADEAGTVHPFEGETDLFVTPGYSFRAVDRLMTNFHLPRSTLFMLVCAFCGIERMQAAYAHAVAAEYRFFSYGDACFLEPAAPSLGSQQVAQ